MSNQNLGGIKPKRGLRPPTQAEIQEFELAYDANGNALYTKVGTSIIKIMGQSHYLHVRYASSGNPAPGEMTESPIEGTTHMGIAISQMSDAPTTPGSYSWTRTQGPQGPQGNPGEGGEKGESAYSMIVLSSNGEYFRNGEISTVLTARVFYGSQDITDQLDSNQFKWTRVSSDSEADTLWNAANASGVKTVEITSEDVKKKATFFCEVEEF